MTLPAALLGIPAAGLLAGLWACLAATVYHFRLRRKAAGGEPVLPMTLIKPVRGLDEGLRENFESIVFSDPESRLQVIIALEGADDPAYPVARAFAQAHPGRDVEVLLTGPSGARMGKIHNMIEAYPRAKHPRVVFSDADVRTSPELLRETSRAFRSGYDAVFGLPYHCPVPGFGGWCFSVAFNHSFCLPAALSYYLGAFRACAGAWMGYTKDILEKSGGLERHAHAIADDFAISDAVFRAGARRCLLPELVELRETGRSAREAFEHLGKWSCIIRWCLPALYFAMPCVNLGVLAALFWGVWEAEPAWLGKAAVCAAFCSRALVGWIQDAALGRGLMAWWGYLLLAFADLGSLVFWAAGLRSRITWRGKTYRLSSGGKAEVLRP